MSPVDHERPGEEPLPPTWVQPPPVASAPEEPPPRWVQGVQSAMVWFGLAGEEPPAEPEARPTGWRRIRAVAREWLWLVIFAYLVISNYRDHDWGELTFVVLLFGGFLGLALVVKLASMVARRRGYPITHRADDHPPADR